MELREEGHCEGNSGYGVEVVGPDGNKIHPNRLLRIKGREVAVHYLTDAGDTRGLSKYGPNGVYVVHAIRLGSQAVVSVTFVSADTGVKSVLVSQKINTHEAKNNCLMPLALDIQEPIKTNLVDAALLAVFRSYNENPIGYSLDPKMPTIVQMQLAARSGAANNSNRGEVRYGRNRPDRTVVSEKQVVG